MRTGPGSLSIEMANGIDAFESALAINPDADFASFLPLPTHTAFLPTLAELIRTDLETAWQAGKPRRLHDYLSRFPQLHDHHDILEPIAFEEYRQRRQAGHPVSRDEYAAEYGLDTSTWPARDDTASEDSPATMQVSVTPAPIAIQAVGRREIEAPDDLSRWMEAAKVLPEVGSEFLGFRLVCELGRGAFGCVYLAQQGDLGSRYVALKIACDIASESVTLAQLQHTNIVPIYSFHRSGPYQAVCMPYFGATTLAQVLHTLRGTATLPNSGRDLRSVLNSGLSMTTFGPGSSFGSSNGDAINAGKHQSSTLETRFSHEGWRRLDRLSYVEAILTLGAQLAEGLSHAHARGIIHRDMKPANVLLTDDGRPMLLDFNLAEDTKIRGTAEYAAIGGTLQYMSPEHMEAFQARGGLLDARCDIYSLGVMLFELLTGQHPFPSHKGPMQDRIVRMLADRKTSPALRPLNAAVSPCVESIVQKCLAPNPADRYQLADHLRDDIERQIHNLPLKYAYNRSVRERARKWIRRHPRLTSSGTIAALAAGLLVALACGAYVARDRSRHFQARAVYADHREAFAKAQLVFDDRNQSRADLETTLNNFRAILERYGVPDDGSASEWSDQPNIALLGDLERDHCRTDIGEAFYLMAQVAQLKARANPEPALLAQCRVWTAAAEKYAGSRLPRAILEQKAALAELEQELPAAKRFRDDALKVDLESPRDLFLVGAMLTREGRHREALPYAVKATQIDPKNFSAWFVRGNVHSALEQADPAAMCFGACLAIRDDFAPAWLNRGRAFGKLGRTDEARDDFDRAVSLDPKLVDAFILRAQTWIQVKQYSKAEEDFARAMAVEPSPARILFLRADLRRKLNDDKGADADLKKGLTIIPHDETGWIARSEVREETSPEAALDDVEEALKLNPTSATALQQKAHLYEILKRYDDALSVLNRSVDLYPGHVEMRAGRGVQLARFGRREEAHHDARIAIKLDSRAPISYQVACIYALTSKTNPEDKREATRLLWLALKQGFGLDVVDTDTDLDLLRSDEEFKQVVNDARVINRLRKQ